MAITGQDLEQHPDEQPAKGERVYVVLARIETEEDYAAALAAGCRVWCEPGCAPAATDESAIGAIVPAEEAGQFVGVPERYFRPRTRSFEPQPPKPVWS